MERINDLSSLHPVFLAKVQALRSAIKAAGLPMDVYETWRMPSRQRDLWRKGRETLGPHATFKGDPEKLADVAFRVAAVHADLTALGRTVTKAQPFWSFHQYGMAADFVFFPNATAKTMGFPSWDEPVKGQWDTFTELAHKAGLRTLSFERPHVELPVSIDSLRRGEYPSGGNEEWEEALFRAIADGTKIGIWTPPPASERPALGGDAA